MAENQPTVNASDPTGGANRRRQAVIGFLSLSIVLLSAAVWLYASGFFDGSKPAREVLLQYAQRLTASDASGAQEIAIPTKTRGEIDDAVSAFKEYGKARSISVYEENFFQTAAGDLWFLRGTARFTRGSSGFDARVQKINGSWKVQGMMLYGGGASQDLAASE